MYLGTSAGDTISLYWNQRSFAYPTLDNYLPFNGAIPQINFSFLTGQHTIVHKVDHETSFLFSAEKINAKICYRG